MQQSGADLSMAVHTLRASASAWLSPLWQTVPRPHRAVSTECCENVLPPQAALSLKASHECLLAPHSQLERRLRAFQTPPGLNASSVPASPDVRTVIIPLSVPLPVGQAQNCRAVFQSPLCLQHCGTLTDIGKMTPAESQPLPQPVSR